MAGVRELDQLLGKLDKWGVSGNLPVQVDPEKAVEELSFRVNELTDIVRTLIGHARQGPDFSRSFKLDWADVDGTTKLITINHGLGFTPTRFVVVRERSLHPEATTIANMGQMRLTYSDDNIARFQYDNNAWGQVKVFFVCLYREGFIPPAGVPQQFQQGEQAEEEGPLTGPQDHTGV